MYLGLRSRRFASRLTPSKNTDEEYCDPHDNDVSLSSPYDHITPLDLLYNKPDASRVRSRGNVRAWITFLSPRPRPTIHHPKIPKVSPGYAGDENMEDTRRKTQCIAPRRPGPEESGGPQKPPAGPLAYWPKIRATGKSPTTGEFGLSPGRVFVTSVLCGQNTRSALCPTLSRILASGARYIPPGFHQQ